jgi:hypothetical protein
VVTGVGHDPDLRIREPRPAGEQLRGEGGDGTIAVTVEHQAGWCLRRSGHAEPERDRDYDLVIADEAWDVDHFLHENPELKRSAFAWFTDFVGWLPMPDGGDHEAFLTADYNAEMIEHIERYPRIRDRAIFVGDRDDIVTPFGSFAIVEAVRSCGGKPRLTIYPDTGHDAWTRTYDDPALYDWLLRHSLSTTQAQDKK